MGRAAGFRCDMAWSFRITVIGPLCLAQRESRVQRRRGRGSLLIRIRWPASLGCPIACRHRSGTRCEGQTGDAQPLGILGEGTRIHWICGVVALPVSGCDCSSCGPLCSRICGRDVCTGGRGGSPGSSTILSMRVLRCALTLAVPESSYCCTLACKVMTVHMYSGERQILRHAIPR